MPRRRKQHTPLPYAIVPRSVTAALADDQIDSVAFALWVVMRMYVRDTVRGEFSPPPIDLSNRELAAAAGVTPRAVVRILNRLEEVGLLRRLSPAEKAAQDLDADRWLQLLAPERVPHE